MANVINWFEIPTRNLDKAVNFYKSILGGEFYTMEMGGYKMGFFPMEEIGIGGALVEGEGCVPQSTGTLVYLNANPDLSIPLAKVEAAGGKILMPKTLIRDDIGYMATFLDIDGNKVAFHSLK